MPRSRFFSLLAPLLLALAPAACDLPEMQPRIVHRAPRGVTYDSQPLLVSAEELAKRGGEIFVSSCSNCHGPRAEGRVGIGPRLASASFLAAASDEFLKHTIKHGRAGTTMTAWGNILQPNDLNAVIGFVRSLAPHEPAKLDERPVRGDLAAGSQVFNTICVSCHGKSGAGYMESSSGTGIGRKAFLESVSDGFLRHIIREGKSLTKMRSFRENAPTAVANLTDQQIEDVIAYLRANAW